MNVLLLTVGSTVVVTMGVRVNSHRIELLPNMVTAMYESVLHYDWVVWANWLVFEEPELTHSQSTCKRCARKGHWTFPIVQGHYKILNSPINSKSIVIWCVQSWSLLQVIECVNEAIDTQTPCVKTCVNEAISCVVSWPFARPQNMTLCQMFSEKTAATIMICSSQRSQIWKPSPPTFYEENASDWSILSMSHTAVNPMSLMTPP